MQKFEFGVVRENSIINHNCFLFPQKYRIAKHST
jgi:hypothetical protein